MKNDELSYANLSMLYNVRNYLANEDEYSVFGPICPEMGLAHDHAEVLEIMDKNTSLSWNEKLWCYLRCVCISGAKNNAIMLCRTSLSRKPAYMYEQKFIEDFGKPQHEKAEGIYIATRNQYDRVFPVSDDEIKIMRTTHILINVPKEEKAVCKFIMLAFIYPGEVKPAHLKGFELMYNVYTEIKKEQTGLLNSK